MTMLRLPTTGLFILSLVTVMLTKATTTDAAAAARDCSTRREPITLVAKSAITGEYIIVEDDDETMENDGESRNRKIRRRRRLGDDDRRTIETTTRSGPSSVVINSSNDKRRRRRKVQEESPPPTNNENNNDDDDHHPSLPYDEVFEMRKCPCSRNDDARGDTYCNLENWVCLIPRNPEEDAWCEAPTVKQRFVGNVFPAIWFWYLILILGACTSNYGKQISGYVLSWCFKHRNERLVDDMLEHNPNQANWLLRRYLRRSRARGEAPILFPVNFDPTTLFQWLQSDGSGGGHGGVDDDDDDKPSALALRTKIYTESDTAVQRTLDEENEFKCTICFSTIQEGDRVGELPCNHAFHVECLKTWLKRRNTCPYCLHAGIAEPRFDAITDASSSGRTAASTTTTPNNAQQDSTTTTIVDENDDHDGNIVVGGGGTSIPEEMENPRVIELTSIVSSNETVVVDGMGSSCPSPKISVLR